MLRVRYVIQSLLTVLEYNQKISVDTVCDIYKEFDEIAIRLLKLADPNGFRVWKLMDMDEIPHWSTNHTVMIGDACHPVVPFGFSGASMAIEDAVTLATLFPPDLPKEQVKDRLQLFERIRKPRVARVRNTSRELARGRQDPQFTNDYREFLSSHDAVEYAEQELANHLHSK
jgi:salicylate hydroxylase